MIGFDWFFSFTQIQAMIT